MKCEFCDEEITEGAFACPRCGSPVTKKAVQQAQPQAPGRGVETPRATETGQPVEPPLAKLEEDFIALSEESVSFEQGGVAPPQAAVPGQPATNAAADISMLADASVLPGAHVPPDQAVLDNSLISGYKAEGGGASVAGAGVQTADDPFGLNITEKAPPTAEEAQESRRFDLRRTWNVLIMIAGLLVVIGVIGVGVYFLFFRESKPSAGDPRMAVEDFFTYMATSADTKLPEVAIPSAPLIEKTRAVLFPYLRDGVPSLAGFKATTTAVKDNMAQVRLDELKIRVKRPANSEVYEKDLLETTTKPYPIPSEVNLIKVNGKWLINS